MTLTKTLVAGWIPASGFCLFMFSALRAARYMATGRRSERDALGLIPAGDFHVILTSSSIYKTELVIRYTSGFLPM